MKKKYTFEKLDKFLFKYDIITEILTDNEIKSTYSEWKANNTINFHDYLWLLFNKAILENGELLSNESNIKKFHQNNYFLYLNMGYFLREEGGAKDAINKFIRLAFEEEIKKNENSQNMVNVITDPHKRCEYSSTLHLKIYKPKEFIDNCFIAKDPCTNVNGCNCSIALTPIRDYNGRLIRVNQVEMQQENKSNQKGCLVLLISLFIFLIL
jgi:hypothetical protein